MLDQVAAGRIEQSLTGRGSSTKASGRAVSRRRTSSSCSSGSGRSSASAAPTCCRACDAGRARRRRADRRGAPRARARQTRRRGARSRRASLQPPCDAVGKQDRARRRRSRAVRGGGSEAARAGARRPRFGSDPSPRSRPERRPAAVRDLPRRARAGRARLAHSSRGGAGAGAERAESRRRHRRLAAVAGIALVGLVGTTRSCRVGALPAVRGARSRRTRCGCRRAGCEDARARGERDSHSCRSTRELGLLLASQAARLAPTQARPRTCCGGRCASRASAPSRTSGRRSPISRSSARRHVRRRQSSKGGSGLSKERTAGARRRPGPREAPRRGCPPSCALTVTGHDADCPAPPGWHNVIATLPVPDGTRFAASDAAAAAFVVAGRRGASRDRRRWSACLPNCRIPRASNVRPSARTDRRIATAGADGRRDRLGAVGTGAHLPRPGREHQPLRRRLQPALTPARAAQQRRHRTRLEPALRPAPCRSCRCTETMSAARASARTRTRS